MFTIDIKYEIDFDANKKKSYKSLKIKFKNSLSQVQDVSSVFIIKPNRDYNEQNIFDFSNGYDLSFSDISSIEFTENDFEMNKLIPGVWRIGYSNNYNNNSINLNNIKTIHIPYRDFLFDNNYPLMTRDDNNLDIIFLTLNNDELFDLKKKIENNFFSFGKKNIEDVNSYLRLFLDFQLWIPEKENTIDNTSSNWTLPDNYTGPTDLRLFSVPTYYTDESGIVRLYKKSTLYNEPGLSYNSASIKKKVFFLNKLANIEYTNTTFNYGGNNPKEYYNTLYEQFYKIQHDNKRRYFSLTIVIKSILLTSTSIDNWELDLYIPEGEILENIGGGNKGYFSYSKTGSDDNFLMGIRGTGYDNDTDGSNNFICVDKNGVFHKTILANYGVKMKGTSYLGGFSIKYKIRKNTDNNYDIFIFIKDQFVMKIKDGGIPLNEIKNWGLPTNYNNSLMKANSCISMLYESIEETYIDDIYNKDNVKVTWKKSKRIETRSSYLNYDNTKITIPISNSVLSDIANFVGPKQIFDFSGNAGGHIYPVSMKETNSNLATSDISDNYIFFSGNNNKFYIDVNDFNFYFLTDSITKDNSNNRLSIETSNKLANGVPVNWTKPEIEWMHKETIEQNLISDTYYDISLNKESTFFKIENDPVLFKNEINLDYSMNDIGGDTWEYIFDAGEERQIVLDISGGDFNILSDQSGNTAYEILEQDKLTVEISDTSDNWITPEVDWLYKNVSTIETVETILHGTSSKNIQNTPIMYYDPGGNTVNYPNNVNNTNQIFNTDSNKTISLEIQDFQFENYYDYLKIEGSYDNGSTWEPANNYWMKNNRNYYSSSASFNGNYFPPDIFISKLLIYGDGNDPRHIYLNLPYSRVKFSFYSDYSVRRRGWKMKVFSTDEKYLTNGNIFPQKINVNKLIQTNKRFIKLKYKGGGIYNSDDICFKLKVHSYTDLENKYGNFFPRTISDAKKMANVEHFEDINRIVLDCSYVKINYRQEDINNNTKFDIVIDNEDDTYYDISLNSDISGQMFTETIFKKSYPVKFMQNLDISAGEYSYTFDSGESNSIQMLFTDFSFNHIEDISGNITDISQSMMSFSLSKNNIDWVPLSVSWMHKSNDYNGNSFGGSIPNGSSWLQDKNGFILPKNKEKALCVDLSLNPLDIVYSDLSFNKVNKIRTEYRYLKILYKSLISSDNSSWDIKIFIKENEGINGGFLSNKNNIQLVTRENQISNIVQEIYSSELNLTTFKDSNECVKNKKIIPYITKYDYELRDISNNIYLKSQIDTDILYENIENNTYNYNGKRTAKEINFLPDIITNNDIQYEIRQKYNYNVKSFNNKNKETSPYIPEMAEKKFFAAAKTVRLTIPDEQVIKLRENLITHWNGDDVPTYVDYIFYVWTPFTDKAEIVLSNTDDNIVSDLSINLNIDGSNEILEIRTDAKTYFDKNLIGMPQTNNIDYELTEFTGVYIFSWSYRVFQPTGSYNSVSPSDFKIYEPSCNIIDLADYLKDDFIYDTLEPVISYTSLEENLLINNNFDKITITLSEIDKTNFNLFSKKYKKNLMAEGYDISSVKLYFYIWTPNNEISNQENGWALPDDYYGVMDPRISKTPYMFETLPYGVSEYIWDPFFSINQQTELGYNINASGTIFKEFDIQKNNIDEFLIEGSNDVVYDISSMAILNYGTVIVISQDNTEENPDDTGENDISENDISENDISENVITEYSKYLPNPYDYSKNEIFGIPYLARWGYTIYTTKPVDNSEPPDLTKGYINIESRVQQQTGTLGNPDTDFNFKFKFNKDYYLELDKNTLAEYQGTTEFKDFKNTGLTLGFIKGSTYLVSKINDLFWQVTIEIPPIGYVFDHLDENGNILGQISSVESNNNIDLSGVNLKYEGNLDTTLNFDSINLSFEEKNLASIDAGRKYKLFIRKSTEKEKIFFSSFVDSTLIQFENSEITTRLSDWYPFNVNYSKTTNQYKYGVLHKTQEITIVQDVEEIERIDPCGLCKPITKTKEILNLNVRYARNVENFRAAARTRGNC